MIMEYAEGGELFNYILEKKYLSEDESRRIFQQIIDAIYYLHQIGVCHRDLKLENILFSSKKRDRIKIIDFGLSNLYLTGVNSENPALAIGADFLETPCGSPGYTPPEMILGCKYDGLLTDIWSSGIILYSMLCGFLPFDDPSEEKLYSKIIKGEFFFPSHIDLSEEAKILIGKILVVNPRLRANIKDIRRNPWFLKDYKPILGLYISIRDIPVSDIILEEMEKYGYNKETIVDNIKRNKHNKITTFYYLLVNKFLNEGTETESDLISDKYNNYLKEQDLKNNLTKKDEKPISLKIVKENSELSMFNKDNEKSSQEDSAQKYDLEYFTNLIKQDIFNNPEKNSEENEENNKKNNEIQDNKSDTKNKGKLNKKAKSDNKNKDNINNDKINNNNEINIHPLKNKTEKLDYNLNKINDIKIVGTNNKKSIKKYNKKSFEKNSINNHMKNRLSERGKDRNIIVLFDYKKKYSYSTSITKKKSKKMLSEDNLMKLLSYNKNKKIKFEDYQKIIKKNKEENSKNFRKTLNNKENQDKKLKKSKISKLYSLQKDNNQINKININTNITSKKRMNSSLNRDIISSINNINNSVKVNQIKNIKDKNLKAFQNKKRNYYDSFYKGITSRNYLKTELNDPMKTTRQFKNRFILKSTSNSKSKSKSSKSKSIISTDKNKDIDIKIKKKNLNYFNIKINITKPPYFTEINNNNSTHYKINKKTKSNSISKTQYKNKIKSNDILTKHKKYIKTKESNKKKSITMKKLELNKLNNNNYKNKYSYINNEFEEIHSHFNTIKSIENHLTERHNQINLNHILNNKKYDCFDNNHNFVSGNKKIKNYSSNLQKIIPSLKGLTIKDNKKPIIKKNLINLMVGFNNTNIKDTKDNKEFRKSNNDIIQRMSKNKIKQKLDPNNNSNVNNTIKNYNNKYNLTKIRKISPVHKNKKIIKSFVSLSLNSNSIDNSKKELRGINKYKLKINPIKIKEIKSIKICNISRNDAMPKSSRRSNYSDIKERNNSNNNNLGAISFSKEKRKKWRNINEMMISILTKNKINVIKKDNLYEYICKKGNNKIVLELNKLNNDMNSYSIAVNNINSSQKEFESFKKQIINILNLTKNNN